MFLWHSLQVIFILSLLFNVRDTWDSHLPPRRQFMCTWGNIFIKPTPALGDAMVTVSWCWQCVLHSLNEVNCGASGMIMARHWAFLSIWYQLIWYFIKTHFQNPRLCREALRCFSAAPWCPVFMLPVLDVPTSDNLKNITMSFPTEVNRTHQGVLRGTDLEENSTVIRVFFRYRGCSFIEGKPTASLNDVCFVFHSKNQRGSLKCT